VRGFGGRAAKGVPHGRGGRGGSGPDRRATLRSAAARGRRLQASDVHAHETSTKIGEVGAARWGPGTVLGGRVKRFKPFSNLNGSKQSKIFKL
jgi:hypothetical protein